VQQPRDTETASRLLREKAFEAGWERFADKDAVESLLSRIRFAAQHTNVVRLPDNWVEPALGTAATGLRSFAELKDACANGGLERAIEALVPMQVVNSLAPTHIQLQGGRRARVAYQEGQDPSVASRLQDFFGMRETPRVANGTVPLVVQLLAPNQRPVQMTRDLASFWKNLYPQVRRELSRRYPRHKWPEDPLSL
jgi:ATP-dependent helicase HrpB